MTGTQKLLISSQRGERSTVSPQVGAVACFACSMWIAGKAHCCGDNGGILLQTRLQEKLLALQWCHMRWVEACIATGPCR